MAGIDDFTPTEWKSTNTGGGEMAPVGGEMAPVGGEMAAVGGEMAPVGGEMAGVTTHDLVASGEVTLSFGWDFDPTSD